MFQRHDEGFSLVEVLIAMFLLAVLSLAVLPLIISATSLSVTNRDVIAATTLANARLAPLRASFPLESTPPKKCTTELLPALALIAASGTSDLSNPKLTITVTATPEVTEATVLKVCPTSTAYYPRSILITATVKDGAKVLATVPTRILVGAP